MERREAPAEGANLRQAGRAKASLAPSFRDPSECEGWRGPGARGPCEGPGASRRSIAARVVGGRTLLRSSGVAIDGALDEPRHGELALDARTNQALK